MSGRDRWHGRSNGHDFKRQCYDHGSGDHRNEGGRRGRGSHGQGHGGRNRRNHEDETLNHYGGGRRQDSRAYGRSQSGRGRWENRNSNWRDPRRNPTPFSTTKRENDGAPESSAINGDRSNQAAQSSSSSRGAVQAQNPLPTKEAFLGMSLKQQIKALLPWEGVDDLPPLKYPDDFKERQRKALEEVEKEIRREHKERRIKQQNGESDMADSDSLDSDDSESSHKIIVPKVDVNKPTVQEENEVKFLQNLPYCTVFNLGFHTAFLISEKEHWCYCPCSEKMKTWRTIFGVSAVGSCSGNKRFTPHALMAHLNSDSSQDAGHKIATKYLWRIYENYHDEKTHHKALYNLNDKGYENAQAKERKKLRNYIALIETKLEEETARRNEIEKKVEQMKIIEKTNSDLHAKLQQKDELMRQLREDMGISESSGETVAVDDGEITMWHEHISYTLDLWRGSWTGRNFDPKEKRTVIALRTHLTLQEMFRRVLRSTKTSGHQFLFGDLERSHDEENVLKWLAEWDIVVEIRKKGFKEQAVDDGGPTRVFLSKLWKEIGNLKIPGSERTLFDGKQVLCPTTDSTLKQCEGEDATSHARLMYRALGRIFFYCLRTDQHIASSVMPSLYRNYFLRGVRPTSPEYESADLLNHVVALLELDPKKTEQIKLYRDHFIAEYDGDGAETMTNDQKFRASTEDQFIKERKIFVQSFGEGLTLNGRIDLSKIYRPIPLPVLSRIAFAEEGFTVADVIQTLEPLNHAQFKDIQDIVITKKEQPENGEKIVDGLLPDILRDAGEEFARRFVYWVTGYGAFLPNWTKQDFMDDTDPDIEEGEDVSEAKVAPGSETQGKGPGTAEATETTPTRDFKILIEFNPEDTYHESDEVLSRFALPVVHTCVCTLRLPTTAYAFDRDGNRLEDEEHKAKLKEKIEESLLNSEHLEFSME